LKVVPRGAPDAARGDAVRFSRILCPVDFSEGSLAALTYAFSIAQEADARLTIVHAIEIPPELAEDPVSPGFNIDAIHAAARAARLQRLRDLVPASVRAYCTVETIVCEGAAYDHILQIAAQQHSDLIVMGVQGRGAISLLVFGSNTVRVTRAATCPVLVVRQP
jgi:nucleotide-binding universal stress UspA family protein